MASRSGSPLERIRHADSVAHLRALAPEAMAIVGYGQIIPQSVIDIAPLGIINVHASLLPELRGAAPIQWSIARGYEKTGTASPPCGSTPDWIQAISHCSGELLSTRTKPPRSFRRAWPPQVRIYC